MATRIDVIRVTAKFTLPSGRKLDDMVAANEKLKKGIAAMAEATGLTEADFEVSTQAVRAVPPAAAPAQAPAVPEPDAGDDADQEDTTDPKKKS